MLHDIILLATGVLVGAMNAIAGGGMLLGFPVLLATGMPLLTANATTSLIVLPGNIAAAFGYRRYFKKVPSKYLLLVFPVVFGAIIGAFLLRNTSPETFAKFVPELIAFAVILFAFQPLLYRYLHKHIHGPAKLRNRMWPILFVSLAIFPVAIYGGYFGAGFGFIMLSFLGFTGLHEHLHRMNALKTIMTTCVAGAVLMTLAGSGLIDWRDGLVMGFGNLLGGYYGASASQKISSRTIRQVIVVVGIFTVVYLALRSY